jgi:hypothetical protein
MQDSGPIPDDKTMCHRTGFATSCFEGVTKHKCRLWKRVTMEGHPENAKPVDHYDCADSLVDLYLKDMLRRQLQTTATVDSMRKEVREANDAGLVHGLQGINQQLRHLTQDAQAQIANGATPQPLLEDRRD